MGREALAEAGGAADDFGGDDEDGGLTHPKGGSL